MVVKGGDQLDLVDETPIIPALLRGRGHGRSRGDRGGLGGCGGRCDGRIWKRWRWMSYLMKKRRKSANGHSTKFNWRRQ